jgi:hypothetical protein
VIIFNLLFLFLPVLEVVSGWHQDHGWRYRDRLSSRRTGIVSSAFVARQGHSQDGKFNFVSLSFLVINECKSNVGYRNGSANEPHVVQRGRRLHPRSRYTLCSFLTNVLNLSCSHVFFFGCSGMKVYIWQGKSAGVFEKNKASQLTRALDDERKVRLLVDLKEIFFKKRLLIGSTMNN